MKQPPEKRRGPRRDGVQAREAILAAAREQFTAQGYDGATLRKIAGAAGVDAALVSYYFGSKSGLFVESLRLPVNPATVIDGILAEGTHDLGRRLLTTALAVWDEPATGAPLATLLRSAAGQSDIVRDFLERLVLPRLTAAIDAPDARLRAGAVVSQVMGLLFSRHVLRVEPLASAEPEQVVAMIAPTLQRYIDGPPPNPTAAARRR